jgi:hypothetical protein
VYRSARCVCGHFGVEHFRYGGVEGCGHHHALYEQCRCRGYCAISQSLRDELAALVDQVAECERDWLLMDSIDLSLRIPRRDARTVGRVIADS